jgi:pimeloyl-ACP methyl ester carboxylesterase
MTEKAGYASTQPRDRSLRLPDDRVLAWCEYGVPDGTPYFYFHGLPGSRTDGRVNAQSITEAGLRLIAPDRPGFGRSEIQAGKRTYADWTRDVEYLADTLELERFAVVAYSAGGPYALATAEILSDRITRVGIVSGAAPSEMPKFRRGTCTTDRVMTRISPRLPRLARSLTNHAITAARREPQRFGRELNRDFSTPTDRALLDDGYRAMGVELFLEAARNGPAGIVEDFAVWARPSGIDLDRINVPVHLWHGDADRTIPVSHSRWIESRVRSSKLIIWPGVGHLHTQERWAEVALTTLI